MNNTEMAIRANSLVIWIQSQHTKLKRLTLYMNVDNYVSDRWACIYSLL